MSIYKICPHCGAHLDAGEACDCIAARYLSLSCGAGVILGGRLWASRRVLDIVTCAHEFSHIAMRMGEFRDMVTHGVGCPGRS